MKSYQAEGSAVVTPMGAHICYGDSEDHAKRIADGMNEAADVRGTLLAALQWIAGQTPARASDGLTSAADVADAMIARARAAIAQTESKI